MHRALFRKQHAPSPCQRCNLQRASTHAPLRMPMHVHSVYHIWTYSLRPANLQHLLHAASMHPLSQPHASNCSMCFTTPMQVLLALVIDRVIGPLLVGLYFVYAINPLILDVDQATEDFKRLEVGLPLEVWCSL